MGRRCRARSWVGPRRCAATARGVRGSSSISTPSHRSAGGSARWTGASQTRSRHRPDGGGQAAPATFRSSAGASRRWPGVRPSPAKADPGPAKAASRAAGARSARPAPMPLSRPCAAVRGPPRLGLAQRPAAPRGVVAARLRAPTETRSPSDCRALAVPRGSAPEPPGRATGVRVVRRGGPARPEAWGARGRRRRCRPLPGGWGLGARRAGGAAGSELRAWRGRPGPAGGGRRRRS